MADEQRDRRGKRYSAATLLDRVNHLREHALKNNDWDPAAWNALADDMRGLTPSHETRAVYDAFLVVMPSAAAVVARYAEMELGPIGSHEVAKALFERYLFTIPTVELHQLYLKYIKHINEGKGAAGVDQLRAAYEFVLEVVGQDMGAGPVWSEYIQFLQDPKPGSEAFRVLFPDAMEGQEEAARTMTLRRVYQRAVQVPCNQVEGLWRSYEQWEVKIDRQLGRKMLDEWRPRYQAARNTQRDRKRRMERIDMDMLPLPPGQGGSHQAKQVELWRDLLKFESEDYQRLGPDSLMLSSRINLTYGQCLTVLWFYPEIWYQHASAMLTKGDTEGAVGVLDKARTALPGCSLLRFLKAELREAHGQIEAAKEVYEEMTSLLESEIPNASAIDPNTGNPVNNPGVASPFGGEQGALIWLQYIRFLRRNMGKADARLAFLQARRWQQSSVALVSVTDENTQSHSNRDNKDLIKDKNKAKPRCNGHQLYSGMARQEWVMDRSTAEVACRIFELGLEDPRLLKDPQYIIAYADFLTEVGDIENARALFERALSEREVSASAQLWRHYANLEAQYGSLAAAVQVEDRMRTSLQAAREPNALPAGAPAPLDTTTASLQVTVCRYSMEGVLPCEATQSTHLERAAALAVSTSGDELHARDALANGHSRDRGRGRDYDRDRPRERYRDGSPDDRRPRDDEGMGMGGAPPDMIELLLRKLPPPNVPVEGPLIPVEAVMDVCFYADMSAGTMSAVCADLDAGIIPSGAQGVEVPQILGMVPGPYDDQGPPPGHYPPHPGAPPPYDDPHYPPGPYGPPEGPYGPGPDPYGPPGPDPYGPGPGPDPYGHPDGYGPPPPPMTRKRRWDGPPDGRGPPPHFDSAPYDDGYDSWGRRDDPPPPHWYEDRRGPHR